MPLGRQQQVQTFWCGDEQIRRSAQHPLTVLGRRVARTHADRGRVVGDAVALRRRGHRAYVEQAVLPNHGTWYRVRVGPFHTQREATVYRAEFERKMRQAIFVSATPGQYEKDNALVG